MAETMRQGMFAMNNSPSVCVPNKQALSIQVSVYTVGQKR